MNNKVLVIGILLLIVSGAFVLMKDTIYNYLGVPSPDELRQSLQSDNPTIQEEASNLNPLAKFIWFFPYLLLGIALILVIIGIAAKGKKPEEKK